MNPNQQPQDTNSTNEPAVPQFGTTPTPPMDSPSLSEQPGSVAPAFGQPAPVVDTPQVSQLEPTPAATTPESTAPVAPAFGQPAPDTAAAQSAFPTPDPATAAQQPVTHAENPGQVLGIISIVLNFFCLSIVSIVLGIISRNKSKAANMPATLGTIGLIMGIVFTVIGILVSAFFVLITVAAVDNLQEAAAQTDSSNQTARESALMDANADTVAKHAEAYFVEVGDYPKTTTDFSKYPDSTLPEDIEVYSSLLLTNSSLTYIYCGEGAAQVAYLGDTTDDKHITALGSASSTEVCPKSL